MQREALLKEMKVVLEARHRPVLGALFTYAFSRISGDLVTGRIIFHDEVVADKRESVDYSSIVLGEEWLDADGAMALLASLSHGTAVVGGTTMSDSYNFPGSTIERQIPPNGGATGWPEWRIDLHRDNSQRQFPELARPLVRAGCRPYMTGAAAAATWVWDEDAAWGGSQPPYLGIVQVAVPDTRARVAGLSWGHSSVSIMIQGSLDRRLVEVQGRLHGGPEIEHPESVTAPETGNLVWPLAGSTNLAEIFLVKKDDSLLLDCAEFRNTGVALRTPEQANSPTQRAARDLQHGETETVEFKPFLDESKGDGKQREVVETVVAFSNTAGGRLYVGVQDDATPCGATALQRAARASPEDAAEKMRLLVTKLIREKIKPVPQFSCEQIEITGEPVIVFIIEPGKLRPYSTHENHVFVRKGATNSRPDPRTELRHLYRPDEDQAVPVDWPPTGHL